MIELVGWIGAILFAFCGIPQAYHSWKNKNSHGMSWTFLWMWFWGEILTFGYVATTSFQLPLLFNYLANFLCLVIIMWYRKFPKNG